MQRSEPLEREFMIGLDLDQNNDWTALAVVEWLNTGYAVPMLTRGRGTAHPAIVGRVVDLPKTPPLKDQWDLVIDATGVGSPVWAYSSRPVLIAEPSPFLQDRSPRALYEWPCPYTTLGTR